MAIIKSSLFKTVRVKISDLKLKGDNNEWGYFEIQTKNYDELNQAQRKLAEAVYGTGNDFVEAMQMLNADGRSVTRVYVLKEGYVKQHTREGPIAWACWFYGFVDYSDFGANERDVGYHIALRGVPKNVAEGDAQKINAVEKDYIQEGILNYLKTNPIKDEGFAARLLYAVYTFYQNRLKQ